MTEFMLRPDAKGRVSLGELAKGVSSYKVTQGDNGQVTLIPYTEIPYAEKWIFENPEILEKFKKQFEETKKPDVLEATKKHHEKIADLIKNTN